MGTNNKNTERTFYNGSPSNNKKYQSGAQQQRPSPSKSINIKTPNKNQSSAINNSNKQRLSGSCSPPNFSFFAGSKCFESPSPQSLPKPPTSWFDEAGMKSERSFISSARTQKARKSLNLTVAETPKIISTSCAAEFAMTQNNSSFGFIGSNEHYTQNLKMLLNVNA